MVLAQGDTTTVMTLALACFYHRLPFGHVEVGLRTWDMQNPFQEEANRVIAGLWRAGTWRPRRPRAKNLLREELSDADIVVTGKTVIDALLMTASKEVELGVAMDHTKRLVLVTSHRWKNFGEPFCSIAVL